MLYLSMYLCMCLCMLAKGSVSFELNDVKFAWNVEQNTSFFLNYKSLKYIHGFRQKMQKTVHFKYYSATRRLAQALQALTGT